LSIALSFAKIFVKKVCSETVKSILPRESYKEEVMIPANFMPLIF